MKASLTICLATGLWIAAGAAQTQGLPAVRIWLAAIEDGIPVNPVPVSAETGYNNQPLFSPDGKAIYYTAEQSGGQTDVARYEIAGGRRSIVAASAESEYSPTPIPGQAALSVVRVEPDQRQRLWRIDLESGEFTLLLPNVEPVGYHTWFTQEAVAMFILGDSFTLQQAEIGDGPAALAFDNIGRTLRKHPRSAQVLFVDKNTEPWRIAAIDMETGESEPVMNLFPGHEDFEVDGNGRYWMGSGSKLYRSDEENRRWMLAADLREYGLDNITRLGISPDGKSLAIAGSP